MLEGTKCCQFGLSVHLVLHIHYWLQGLTFWEKAKEIRVPNVLKSQCRKELCLWLNCFNSFGEEKSAQTSGSPEYAKKMYLTANVLIILRFSLSSSHGGQAIAKELCCSGMLSGHSGDRQHSKSLVELSCTCFTAKSWHFVLFQVQVLFSYSMFIASRRMSRVL